MKPLPIRKLGPQIFISNVNGKLSCGQNLEVANFIKIIFNFSYYLGVSPIRFVLDTNRTPFFREAIWKPQQISCFLLHVLCILKLVSEIREYIPKDWTENRDFKNPTKYFDIAMILCTFFYKLVTLKRLWFNWRDYLKILNYIVQNNCLPVPITNKWITKPSFIYTIYTFNLIKVVSSLVTGYNLGIPLQEWSPSLWLCHLWGHAKFVFCFAELDIKSCPPDLESFTVWDGVLVGLFVVTMCIRYTLSELCDLIILACVLTLWTPASSFSNEIDQFLCQEDDDKSEEIENLDLIKRINVQEIMKTSYENHNSSTWSLIYSSFQSIQKLSDRINAALGSQVSWYMAEGLLFYSINLHTVLLTNDQYRRFHKVAYYVLTFFILYTAADICQKMENARSWLCRDNNINSAPANEANLVLHEMLAKEIGVQGSDAFTLTYPLIAGYLSLIVTFFIICVQENEHPST